MQPKISITVPVHNAEPHLEECLTSISSQTFQEIEILCIDDASTDRSSSIVQDLAATDPRIKLLSHTHNLGPGGARNTGINHALADHIANVDSDDWIDPDMFELLYAGTLDDSVDIVCCGWKHLDADGELLGEQGPQPGLLDNTNNQLNIFNVLNPAPWNKLVRKSLYTQHSIWFPHYISYQDLATTPRLVARANKVHIIPEKPYNYIRRNGSITYSFGSKNLTDYLGVFTVLRQFLEDNELYDRYRDELSAAINANISYYVRGMMRSPIPDESKKLLLRGFLHIRKSFEQNFQEIEQLTFFEMAKELGADAATLAQAEIASAA